MSIQSEIDRLTAAKNSIAASLEDMGIEPPAGTTLDQYAAQLAAIAASAPWLPLSGGTLTGTLNLSNGLNMYDSKISNLAAPTADTDAATKGYTDSALDDEAPAYTYGTTDLEAGVSALETGKLYFVYSTD